MRCATALSTVMTQIEISDHGWRRKEYAQARSPRIVWSAILPSKALPAICPLPWPFWRLTNDTAFTPTAAPIVKRDQAQPVMFVRGAAPCHARADLRPAKSRQALSPFFDQALVGPECNRTSEECSRTWWQRRAGRRRSRRAYRTRVAPHLLDNRFHTGHARDQPLEPGWRAITLPPRAWIMGHSARTGNVSP